MNEILDMIVGNDFIFFGLLIFLGITLIVLIFSVTRKSKKHRKIPIYEEDLEDQELKKVKEDNIIDKPEVKKEKKNVAISKEKKEVEIVPEKEEKESKESPSEEPEKEEEPIVEEENPDRLAELEQMDEEEIKERIIKEHEEDIEEAIEEFDDEEMTGILQNLKEAKEVKPEDVVRQFEQEQEAQSIISYQELVDVVKNRDNQFEDELESKPLATVSDFLPETSSKETEGKDQEMLALIEQLEKPKQKEEEDIEELLVVTNEDVEVLEPSEEEIEVLQANHDDQVEQERIESTRAMVREALKDIPTDGKFKKTELISPVFGRIKEETEDSYPTVPKFSREKEEDLIEELELPITIKNDNITNEATEENLFEDISDATEEENVPIFEEIPVEEERKEEALFEEIPTEVEEKEDLGIGDISKNEEFLKALKDFRDSL